MLPMSGLEYDWYHPQIRFVCVPRSRIDIQGPFEREMRSLAEKVAAKSGKALPDNLHSVLMPVHELQIPNIASKFQDVKILDSDISVKGFAQSSIRYITITPYFMLTTLMTGSGLSLSPNSLEQLLNWLLVLKYRRR